MKRRAVRIAFGLGLLLTLAATALWVRGFWVRDEFYVTRVVADGGVVVDRGVRFSAESTTFMLYVHRYEYGSPPSLHDIPAGQMGSGFFHTSQPSGPFWLTNRGPGMLMSRLGFRFTWGRFGRQFEAGVFVPAWFVVLMLALLTALPGMWLRRDARRRRRAANGQCVPCGYDLRGAEHERCPECGAVVERHSHGPSSALSTMK
jgi:hypothetical protein